MTWHRDELVFAVDLTPEVMATCRAEIEGGVHLPPRELPPRPPAPIRVVALLTSTDKAPLLIPIEPTDDVVMLDAMARLVRISLLYDRSFKELVDQHGDALVRALYQEHRFPRFIYEGFPSAIKRRLERGG